MFWLVQDYRNHMNSFYEVLFWDHWLRNIHSWCCEALCMKGSTEDKVFLVYTSLAVLLYVGWNDVWQQCFSALTSLRRTPGNTWWWLSLWLWRAFFFFIPCRCFFMRPQWGWWLGPVPQGHTSCWNTTSDAGHTAPTQPVRATHLFLVCACLGW